MMGGSMLALVEIHSMLADMGSAKEAASTKGTVIIRITVTRAAFFFKPGGSDIRKRSGAGQIVPEISTPGSSR